MWISNNTVNKVVLNQVRASNNILALGGRNVLVVGGTGGIGIYINYLFYFSLFIFSYAHYSLDH